MTDNHGVQWKWLAVPFEIPGDPDDAQANELARSLFARFFAGYDGSPDQALRLGYLKLYQRCIFALARYSRRFYGLFELGNSEGWNAKRLNEWGISVRGAADEALGLFSDSYSTFLDRAAQWREAERPRDDWILNDQDMFEQYASTLLLLGWYHPIRTAWGAKYPYATKQGEWAYFAVNPTQFPSGYPAIKYWPTLGFSFNRCWYGETLEPGDVPLQNGASCDFPTIPEDEADDYRKQSDRLLDEAITNKHRVIPTGAIVQQPFGPLRSFEIHEFENRIVFVARDKRGHFAVMYFWREDDGEWYFACENAVLFDDATARLNRESAVALRYVLALIIRDFWILDQRELKRIFTDQNPKKIPGIRIRRKPDGTPRIVYLPKIVYSNSLPPRAAAGDALWYANRVGLHIRESPPTRGAKGRIDLPQPVRFGLSIQIATRSCRPRRVARHRFPVANQKSS